MKIHNDERAFAKRNSLIRRLAMIGIWIFIKY